MFGRYLIILLSRLIWAQDATTNPTLLLTAANKPQYAHLVNAALDHGRCKGGTIDDQVDAAMDCLVCICFSGNSSCV